MTKSEYNLSIKYSQENSEKLHETCGQEICYKFKIFINRFL